MKVENEGWCKSGGFGVEGREALAFQKLITSYTMEQGSRSCRCGVRAEDFAWCGSEEGEKE